MKTSMIRQDAQTFVALGQAVSLALSEGAIDREEAEDLTASLVVGILAGGMHLETYARVHETLARLLERAFEGPAKRALDPQERGPKDPATEGPLDVYLEVVGDAWEKVGWEHEGYPKLSVFVHRVFDLAQSRFGDGAWFRAPLRTDFSALVDNARKAGLLIVSLDGFPVEGQAEAALRDPESLPAPMRVVLGWGDRRAALDISPAAA